MFRKLWIELRSSLWFTPALLVIAGILCALGLVELDLYVGDALQFGKTRPFFGAGTEGARGMLSAIASSMITVAGVAFSVTIVALSLASTQYTPRILRNFMRDPANQFVLGVFVGIYTYCLIVLRAVRSGDSDAFTFVPLLSVTFALLLALLGIGCLIFFIHHVATSIQASSILDSITRETSSAIDHLFPEELGEEAEPETLPGGADEEWHSVSATASGYLQNVHNAGVLEFARERDTVLRLDRSVGDFITEDLPLLRSRRELDDDACKAVRSHFIIGDFRTVEQDAGFGIRQIVDIAMKALSPGVNDTSTAVSCLDYLGTLLVRLADRRIESPFRADAEEGRLRVVAPAPRFADFVSKALDEIRHSAFGNVTIILHLLRVLQRLAAKTRHPSRRAVLSEHVRAVAEMADRTVPATRDRAWINRELERTRPLLGETEPAVEPLPSVRTAAPW